MTGLFAVVLTLAAVGCDHQEKDSTARNDDTPAARFHAAVRQGDLSHIELFIEEGCDVDVRDKDGRTPLFTATAHGQIRIVEFLIARGADVNAGVDRGDTPLYAVSHLSDDQTHEDIVRALLDCGAAIVPSNTRENGRLLYFAVTRQMHGFIGKLLAAGTSPNTVETGATGMTVLGKAVALGDTEAVRLLIAAGADVNGKDAQDMPPLRHAHRWSRDAAELLLDKGADPNRGCLLHYFVEADEKEILELCLTHGADVNARNLGGETPLDIAVSFSRGREEIAELLKSRGALLGASPQISY